MKIKTKKKKQNNDRAEYPQTALSRGGAYLPGVSSASSPAARSSLFFLLKSIIQESPS